jgi:hypothetical protein
VIVSLEVVAVCVTNAVILQGLPDATIPAMPFSPSDLPWWGWLLCSAVAWIFCAIFSAVASEKSGCLAALAALASGLIGAVTGVMGVVLFIKWVWYS